MFDLENMSKEELIKLIDSKCNRDLEKRLTIKECLTPGLLKSQDYLFVTSNGLIIAKPYLVDEEAKYSPYLILENVAFLKSLHRPTGITGFPGLSFNLAIDQIVAFAPIDRESFLTQLQAPQQSQD